MKPTHGDCNGHLYYFDNNRWVRVCGDGVLMVFKSFASIKMHKLQAKVTL